jgi:hypothetical protein
MIEPWFSEEVALRFAFLSLLSLFALVEIPAQRGRHRQLVMASWNAVLVFSALLLIAAVLAWSLGQPRHVVFSMGLSGLVIGSVFLVLKKAVVAAYREAEVRKTIAADL